MADLKQSAKIPSHKRVSKSPKAQQPSKPFLSAEFVHDTSDEDSEQSLSGNKRSPILASKKVAPTRKTQNEAPVASAKPKIATPIEKKSKKQKPRSPSPSDSDSSASHNGEDRGSGIDTDSDSESESAIETSSESIAQARKAQQPVYCHPSYPGKLPTNMN